MSCSWVYSTEQHESHLAPVLHVAVTYLATLLLQFSASFPYSENMKVDLCDFHPLSVYISF
jgi:hypothetical protein